MRLVNILRSAYYVFKDLAARKAYFFKPTSNYVTNFLANKCQQKNLLAFVG